MLHESLSRTNLQPPNRPTPVDTYLKISPGPIDSPPASVRAVFVVPLGSSVEEFETLDNIIKACGLTQGKECMVLRLPHSAPLASAPWSLRIDHVVGFGYTPPEFGLVAVATPYLWTAPLGGRRYCFAERLSVVGEDMDRKKRLWNTVKSLKALAHP